MSRWSTTDTGHMDIGACVRHVINKQRSVSSEPLCTYPIVRCAGPQAFGANRFSEATGDAGRNDGRFNGLTMNVIHARHEGVV